jgi:hypothetical protein
VTNLRAVAGFTLSTNNWNKNGGYMKVGWRRTIHAAAAVIACSLSLASVYSQTQPAPKPQMSEQAFKDVRLLKGIPVDQFMDTMGFFAASLGLNCTDCHGDASAGDWSKYADNTPLKTTTRKMIVMVKMINQTSFGGATTVTCYSCHRGSRNPKGRPSLAEQYNNNPAPDDPNDVVIGALDPTGPTADQIFGKYLAALGGAQRLAGLTGYVAKGTYLGWDTNHIAVPVDIFAQAPNKRTTIVHTLDGDRVRAFDGNPS